MHEIQVLLDATVNPGLQTKHLSELSQIPQRGSQKMEALFWIIII
jgi:hypothetical protein